jgi:hypothetical protein
MGGISFGSGVNTAAAKKQSQNTEQHAVLQDKQLVYTGGTYE